MHYNEHVNLLPIYCRYLALESLTKLAVSDFSRKAVMKHQETVVQALKVILLAVLNWIFMQDYFAELAVLCTYERIKSGFIKCIMKCIMLQIM